MRYETYEQIEALDVDALRDVSVRGDSRERVWASWALGLRCGADEADRALEHEPNPGARRHLTIIVAGHGRSATVQRLASALAESDRRLSRLAHLDAELARHLTGAAAAAVEEDEVLVVTEAHAG